jgi:5-formaminoimidazole-4-carboxamide-1-beta-D-ribofuranosyl 5'-monophosphate synthetase
MEAATSVNAALSRYDTRYLALACIGSHSALDVCLGAKHEGLKTIVVAAAGREKTYSQFYRSREDGSGCVDDVVEVGHFADILSQAVQRQLLERNAIFIRRRPPPILRSRTYWCGQHRGAFSPSRTASCKRPRRARWRKNRTAPDSLAP